MSELISFTYKGGPVAKGIRPLTQLHFADGNLWIDSGNISASMYLSKAHCSLMFRVVSKYEELLLIDGQDDAYRDEHTDVPKYFLVALRFDELMGIELFSGDTFISFQLPKESMPNFIVFIAKELAHRYENESNDK